MDANVMTAANARATIAALRTTVDRHPFQAVAGAVVLGMCAAVLQPRLPRNRIARDLFALLGGLGLAVTRDRAARAIASAAWGWLAPTAAIDTRDQSG